MAINRFIPNIADVASNRKESAWPDALHFDVLKAGYNLNGILEGCAISDGGSLLEVDIADGCVIIDGVAKIVASQTVSVAAAHATLPRLDLMTVNTSGVLVANTGVPLAVPVYVAIPPSEVVVGTVLVAATATALTDDDINNTQLVLARQQLVLNRQTTEGKVDTSTDEGSLFQYTLPGRALGTDGGCRVTLGGQLLTNPASLVTLRFKLGATTVFTSSAHAFSSDSDVRYWRAVFEFLNVASFSSQKWLGHWMATPADALAFGINTSSSADYKIAQGYATSSENTANDLVLDMTVEFSVNGANVAMDRNYALVERLSPS